MHISSTIAVCAAGAAATSFPRTDGFKQPSVSLSKGGQAVCVSGFVPVTVSAKNTKYNFQVPRNQSQITQIFLDMITPGIDFAERIKGPTVDVSGTYSIGATLCTPANNTKPVAVQLLTHGVGFDRTYWDFAPGYSYVDVAAESGYASFFYDRLSVGLSAKPDPIQVSQTPIELEIARSLATSLRQGSFSATKFSKVIGAGHSFGSIITEALTAKYPATLDGAILTGFSTNASAEPVFFQGLNLAIAREDQPIRFAALNNAYLVSSTIISNQIGFFRFPGFDQAILEASEATKGTVTFGELFSQMAIGAPATQWTKPLAVVNGVSDLPFCYGNCTVPTDLAAAVRPALYPALSPSNFGSYLAPVAGHGLNLHYSAGGAFAYIQHFLATHGLAA